MVSIIAKFDGEKIELPDELRGAPPANILIVYPAAEQPLPSANKNSFRDFFGKANTNRTAEEIIAQVRQERDSWDEP